jgi:hypothetical protein
MTSKRRAGANRRYKNKTQLKVNLLVSHLFPGIELVSPNYIGFNATCYLSPVHKVDAGTKTQVGFGVKSFSEDSFGVLMYKLQKKNAYQTDEKIISNEEGECIQLVIYWKVDSFGEFLAYSHLIRHEKSLIWDEAKLLKLFETYILYDIHAPIEYTYLMHDNTVLMTSLNATHEEECYRLEITLSETSIKDDIQRLHYIGLNR